MINAEKVDMAAYFHCSDKKPKEATSFLKNNTVVYIHCTCSMFIRVKLRVP